MFPDRIVTTLQTGQYTIQSGFAQFTLNGRSCAATVNGGGNLFGGSGFSNTGYLFPYYGTGALSNPWASSAGQGFYNYPFQGGGGYWVGYNSYNSGNIVNIGGSAYFWVY